MAQRLEIHLDGLSMSRTDCPITRKVIENSRARYTALEKQS
jgi:hypothetical protein